ncbi:MAG TPA: hypothetical protein VEH31_40455, partial [Streptosporangiaceae bacterium]|nr:hypothetical protein [Streptosporangiaceae bacterium]
NCTISAASGSQPILLHNDGSGIFQYTGTPFAWQQIDNNPATVAIAAGLIGPGFGLYLLHNDGSGIFQYTGTPFTWQQIDSNPATVAIFPGYQLHNDGGIYEYTGTPFAWQQVDSNPANCTISAASGSQPILLHNDGSGIFQYTGTPSLAFGYGSGLAVVRRGVLGSGDVAWLLLRCGAGFCAG